MPQIRQDALDEQTRRWMRPDWRRWWKPGHENDPLYKDYERIERKSARISRASRAQRAHASP
jgi:hypothetical protein